MRNRSRILNSNHKRRRKSRRVTDTCCLAAAGETQLQMCHIERVPRRPKMVARASRQATLLLVACCCLSLAGRQQVAAGRYELPEAEMDNNINSNHLPTDSSPFTSSTPAQLQPGLETPPEHQFHFQLPPKQASQATHSEQVSFQAPQSSSPSLAQLQASNPFLATSAGPGPHQKLSQGGLTVAGSAQQQHHPNQVAAGQANKKGANQRQSQNLSKLSKYLSPRQHELTKDNPGSLAAVARALKMAIVECQYQMRNEPWDCPINGFSMRPAEIFGTLMSRSFKETAFIQSLLSSAIAHSIARACTESTITTCGRKKLQHEPGYSEDIDFGRNFARDFMAAGQEQPMSPHPADTAASPNSILTDHSAGSQSSPSTMGGLSEPTVWRERRLRQMINKHNDEVGRLVSTSHHPSHFDPLSFEFAFERTNPFT